MQENEEEANKCSFPSFENLASIFPLFLKSRDIIHSHFRFFSKILISFLICIHKNFTYQILHARLYFIFFRYSFWIYYPKRVRHTRLHRVILILVPSLQIDSYSLWLPDPIVQESSFGLRGVTFLLDGQELVLALWFGCEELLTWSSQVTRLL